jgi:cytochrome c2
MSWLADNRLLVTFGDHGMDGWSTTVQAAQDETYTYGKIISIDPDDGSWEIYSLGHRNPQGLWVTASGQIWSTEHGPDGGDELNLILKGGNYGWPLVSYGTEYGSHSWPLAAQPGSHDKFTEPYYSWTPSIGVSSLIEVTSPLFEHWHGDLLAYSLKDQSFSRLRLRDGRVVMTERFPFEERIREVVQGHGGELVVWSDVRNIHFIVPAKVGDPVSGQAIYRTCAGCHVAPAGGSTAIGPSLLGIVGRAVASNKDFQYSPAMLALGGTWTKDRLDAFLAETSVFVPGTSMTFTGIPDAESRRALIDYLASPDSRLDVAPPNPEM